jgi:hypothetical protein
MSVNWLIINGETWTDLFDIIMYIYLSSEDVVSVSGWQMALIVSQFRRVPAFAYKRFPIEFLADILLILYNCVAE